MPLSRDKAASNDDDPSNRSPSRPGQIPALVIVSERGRHSQASRRIVRAQAARASAAQSRETRARNREDRHRESPQPQPANEGSASRPQSHSRRIQPQPQPQPPVQLQQHQQPRSQSQSQIQSHSQARPPLPPSLHHRRSYQQLSQRRRRDPGRDASRDSAQPSADESSAVDTLKPLVNWITNVLQLTADSLAAAAAALSPGNDHSGTFARDSPASAMEEVHVSNGLFSSKKLPIALPRGFAALQSRVSLSGQSLLLLSRSACFDYDSPGVMHRLNKLLFDIIMTTATSTLLGDLQAKHPIEEPLRIASACLAILSCRRTERLEDDKDSKYQSGLEAAWQEAVALDQEALKDANSAEAALWAVVIISVTCDSTAFFSQLIVDLLDDLRLERWEDVRSVLLNFNYPVTTLDHHCKQFYDRVLAGRIARGA